MPQRIISVVLIVGIFFCSAVLVAGMSGWRLPDDQQGYAPKQPIDYSHLVHAGELQMDCKFCHFAADSSRYAGIPAADVCMKCHKFITSSFAVMREESTQADKEKRKPNAIISPQLKKLYESLRLNDDRQPIEGEAPRSIPWVRVHNLPDYVYFNHQAHVSAGVSCQHCHGPVESMQRVRQYSTLSMGWCVHCHREATATGVNDRPVQASTDCMVCHY